MSTIPTPRATNLEEWTARMTAKRIKDDQTRAVYAAHMSNVANHLYIAGECVRNGEFGLAESRHQLAEQSLAAARKCLTDL